MATPFWEAGAFGARAARIKTRISYVHRISSYRRCARPWAFTNMSGETPYFDFFFVSIRSSRRGSTRSRYLFNSSAGVALTIASTAGRITYFLLTLSSRFFNSSLQLSNADLTAAIAMGISSSISGQGVPPSSSARSAKLYMRPGRTSFLSAYDSMHLSAWRSAYSFSSRQRSQPVEDPGHLPHGFFDFFLFPERGMGMRSHVVKYLSHSGLQPRGELGELLLLRRPMPRRLLLQRRLLRRLLLLRRPMPRRLLLLRRPMPRRLLLLRRPMPRRLLLLRRLLLRRPMLQRRLLLRRPMPRRLLLQRRLLLRRLLLGSSVLM